MADDVRGYMGELGQPADENDTRISLERFIKQALDGQMAVIQTKLAGMQEASRTALEAHMREHEASRVALDRAADAIDRRLDEMNELRHQIERERALYITRPEMEALTKNIATIERALAIQITRPEHDVLISQIRTLENWRSGMEGRLAVLYGAIALVPVLVTVVFKFVPLGTQGAGP